MNFYEHQDRARRNTGRLIALFFGAIFGITLLVWGLAVVVLLVAGNSDEARLVTGEGGLGVDDFPWLTSFAGTFLGVGTLIGGASLFKVAQLRGGGGKMVAESLGGAPISPDTTDPDERKVLNVVEEMAIASGLPVPPVYLMDRERGINAFAAGYRPENAVIGVTRGCVESLTRDELQGVMAHEFAHILNGDMRINIKLMGTIFGILILTVIGRMIMNSAFYAGSVRSSSRESAGGRIAILLIGLGLLVIGFVGVLFGRLIQAAVSRQREFLADASAVQFTRNPDGIGNALRRIGGAVYGLNEGTVGPRGSELKSAHAEEAAHIFFGNAVKSLSGAFATHPPLEQRIARVLPNWDGKFLAPLGGSALPETPAIARAAQGSKNQGLEDIPVLGDLPGVGHAGAAGLVGGSPRGGSAATGFRGDGLERSVGTLDDAHVAAAREILAALPDAVRDAARHPTGCRALVYALLLDRDPAVRETQLAAIERRATGAAAAMTRDLAEAALGLPRALRLPAVDLAVPALSAMANPEYRKFVAVVEALIGADDRVDLFEWALREVVRRHVGVRFEREARDRVTARRLAQVRVPLQAVLSAVSAVGAGQARTASESPRASEEAAFTRGVEVLRRAEASLGALKYVDPREAGGMQTLTAAVDALSGLAPRLKEPVVAACVAAVSADGTVTGGEAELLRVVVESMGVPMPPVLPGDVA
ncbi:MAG: M48 family metallopeptidase [Planctomycetota bacterium]